MNHHDDDLAGPLRDADEAGSRNDTDHDYARLAGGLSARAARVRRRRTVVTGAALVAIAPAMAGAVFLGGRMLDSPGTLNPAGQPAALVAAGQPAALVAAGQPAALVAAGPQAPASTTVDDPTPTSTSDGEAATTITATDDWAPTFTADDGTVFVDPGAVEPVPGEWEVPDAVPGGIPLLDAQGEAKLELSGDDVAPAMGAMTCDLPPAEAEARADLLNPVTFRNWMYYLDDTGFDGIDLTITGWDDGQEAMTALRDDTMVCGWDHLSPGVWPGHEGDVDFFVNKPYGGYQLASDTTISVAAVRTGDYLVIATVSNEDGALAQETARAMAEQSATKLAVLDPEHGTD